MSNLSRRNLVTAAAALPALAVPAVAAAGVTATWHTPIIAEVTAGAAAEPDPIFEVIEAHRTALIAANGRGAKLEEIGTPEAIKELQEIDDAEEVAIGYVCWTRPTTIAGIIALAAYAAELKNRGYRQFFVDNEDDKEKDWTYFMFDSIVDALKDMTLA